jgi:hypothetical protein
VRKVILQDKRKIPPFNEPARDLSVLNKPLWLFQRDLLAQYTTEEREVDSINEIEKDRAETLVYRDNLYFDEVFIEEFITRAKASVRPARSPSPWMIRPSRDKPCISKGVFGGRATTLLLISGITLTGLSRWSAP